MPLLRCALATAILTLSLTQFAFAQEGVKDNLSIAQALNLEKQEKSQDAFPQSQPEPPMPRVLKESIKRGAQSKYLGMYHGLHGWVIIKGGKPEFNYVTADGKAIIMGILFDENGNMITGEQLRMLRLSDGASTYKLSESYQKKADEAYAKQNAANKKTEEKQQPKEPKTTAEKFYAAVENGNWLRMGSRKAPLVYAFIDPDCPHCRKFLKDIKPFIDRSAVQLRILPAGYNEKSLKKAAYLLAAPDPEVQLFRYIEGDGEALYAPGEIQTEGAIKNVAIMRAFEIEGTPIITYKTSKDAIRFVRGAPDSVAVIVDEIER